MSGRANNRWREQLLKAGKERITKLVQYYGSYRKAAEALGVKYGSLWYFLKKEQINIAYEPKREASEGQGAKNTPREGSFFDWLLKHQDITLPRSIKKISLLSGHSEDAVKCFYYRNRTRIRNKLRELPDLRKRNITLKQFNDELIHSASMQTYKYRIDPYSLQIMIVGTLSDGQLFSCPIENLDIFVDIIHSSKVVK